MLSSSLPTPTCPDGASLSPVYETSRDRENTVEVLASPPIECMMLQCVVSLRSGHMFMQMQERAPVVRHIIELAVVAHNSAPRRTHSVNTNLLYYYPSGSFQLDAERVDTWWALLSHLQELYNRTSATQVETLPTCSGLSSSGEPGFCRGALRIDVSLCCTASQQLLMVGTSPGGWLCTRTRMKWVIRLLLC